MRILLIFLTQVLIQAQISSVSPAAFAKAIEQYGTSQLIDVRTPGEYVQGHIADTRLVNIYDADFNEKVLNGCSKEKPVLIYCRSGHRSIIAARYLSDHGFTVINLKPGINGWKAANFPVEK